MWQSEPLKYTFSSCVLWVSKRTTREECLTGIAFVHNCIVSSIIKKLIYRSFQSASRSRSSVLCTGKCLRWLLRNGERCIGTRVDKSRHTPVPGGTRFSNDLDRPRNFVRDLLTCMRARFKYIPAYDGGNSTSSCRHKAAACRVHGYRVQLVRSFSPSLSLSFFLSLPLSSPHLSSPLARTPPWRGSYRALWSESWDRGLAGSHDRWGFGLTPLVWTEPMVPPARGTALSLFLLLTPLRPASFFFIRHLSLSLSLVCLSTRFPFSLVGDEKICFIGAKQRWTTFTNLSQ